MRELKHIHRNGVGDSAIDILKYILAIGIQKQFSDPTILQFYWIIPSNWFTQF